MHYCEVARDFTKAVPSFKEHGLLFSTMTAFAVQSTGLIARSASHPKQTRSETAFGIDAVLSDRLRRG